MIRKTFYFVGMALSSILASGKNLITSLNANEAAAQADFPLVAAFIQDFTKYSYNDYVAALSSQGTSIPYVLNNYFLAFEELSDYQQVESVMLQTFPFLEFAAVITEVPWYTDLLDAAGMSTIYFPSDFSTGIIVTLNSNNNISLVLATEAASASSYISVSKTSTKAVFTSVADSTVSSSVFLNAPSSTSGYLISSSLSSVSTAISVASKSSSKASNLAVNRHHSISLLPFFLVFFPF